MPTVPPDITRADAQVALVNRMLIEHGRSRASELFLIDRTPYRITVERVAAEDIPAATRQIIEEALDDDSSMGTP